MSKSYIAYQKVIITFKKAQFIMGIIKKLNDMLEINTKLLIVLKNVHVLLLRIIAKLTSNSRICIQ